MVNKCLFGGIVCALLFLTGCANTFDAPFKPASGFIVTQYTIPLTPEYTGVSLDGAIRESSQNIYFCWPYPLIDLAWYDTQLEHVSKYRKTSKVAKRVYADLEVCTVLGFFGRYRVNVYGPPVEAE